MSLTMIRSTDPMTPQSREKITTLSDPEQPRAVWFLGSLVRMPLVGAETGDTLAVLEHNGDRGYSAPMHRHTRDDETFIVLDGSLHVVSDDVHLAATSGTTLFLPRGTLHGFVVQSPSAHFLTVHTPGGFDAFTAEAGSPAVIAADGMPAATDEDKPTSQELAAIAARYGIEIVGPPPALPETDAPVALR
jgi:quercetin dioxygenase-like cupin family protein